MLKVILLQEMIVVNNNKYKHMKKIILLALFIGLFETYGNAQSNPSQKEQFQTTYNSMKSLVQSQVYNFVGNVVFDGRKREKLNDENNTIVINKSEISGNVISLQSRNKSFDVNGTIENYKALSNDDKQHISVQFKIKSPTQILEVQIVIKPNGNAVLTVSSNDNNSISWVGHIK